MEVSAIAHIGYFPGHMQDPSRLEIFTDGSCPFCQWIRQKVEPFDSHHRLIFLDYHDPAALKRAAPRTEANLSREIFVRNGRGEWQSGFSAWVQILEELPRLRWLAFLFSAAPMKWIGPVIYRWIARNRYRFLPGMPKPCEQACGTGVNHPQ